jgi:hypothetical protein
MFFGPPFIDNEDVVSYTKDIRMNMVDRYRHCIIALIRVVADLLRQIELRKQRWETKELGNWRPDSG